MSSIYAKLYEKRRNYDPFSSRDSIDSKTALEDIFGAFLGELIEKITRNIRYWETSFIYIPSINEARRSGSAYSPKMILSHEELDALLSRPLSSWADTVTAPQIARTIRYRFSDVRIGLDGLVKLSRRLLDQNNHGQYVSVKKADCHTNSPDSVDKIALMIEAISNVRNPSAHRHITHTDEYAKKICLLSRTAHEAICEALPVMTDVFSQFNTADEAYLTTRYCSLLSRVLDELDKKLNGIDIDPSCTQINYKDLSDYKIFLDESALSGGYTVTLNKLLDEMQVFIYQDSLSSMAKSTANPDAMTKHTAKSALSSFYMSKEKAVLLEDRKETDQKSILETLSNNPTDKFFVVTENRSFAEKILDMGNPRHVVGRPRNDRGEFIIYRRDASDE